MYFYCFLLCIMSINTCKPSIFQGWIVICCSMLYCFSKVKIVHYNHKLTLIASGCLSAFTCACVCMYVCVCVIGICEHACERLCEHLCVHLCVFGCICGYRLFCFLISLILLLGYGTNGKWLIILPSE